MEAQDFATLEPRQDLILDGPRHGPAKVRLARAADGRRIIAYSPRGEPFTLENLWGKRPGTGAIAAADFETVGIDIAGDQAEIAAQTAAQVQIAAQAAVIAVPVEHDIAVGGPVLAHHLGAIAFIGDDNNAARRHQCGCQGRGSKPELGHSTLP